MFRREEVPAKCVSINPSCWLQKVSHITSSGNFANIGGSTMPRKCSDAVMTYCLGILSLGGLNEIALEINKHIRLKCKYQPIRNHTIRK